MYIFEVHVLHLATNFVYILFNAPPPLPQVMTQSYTRPTCHLNMCVSGGRVFERMSRQESCLQCGNMRGLLSCLFLASHCALSSRSGASTLHVSQSANMTVLEGQTVNISCCWTGNFSRVTVEWLKNKIQYKKLKICQKQSCLAALQKDAMMCVWLDLPNVTTEDSGIYICKVSADIPNLMSGNRNGTVVTVTRQSSRGTAEGGVPWLRWGSWSWSRSLVTSNSKKDNGGRVFERMSRQESCLQCGNMRGLLSCLFLASHCALSSCSGASTLHVSQSANMTVLEGQTVNISCCWTGNFSRVTFEWLKNKIQYKKLKICQKQYCLAALQKDAMMCVWLDLPNVTTEDSGIYICNVSADIPNLMSGNGNGTVVTVTRQNSSGTAEGGESTSPNWALLGGSLASVGFLLLVSLACYCKLKQRQVTRVIYESPNLDSDMDKRSSGGSSTGSTEWRQVVVYESVDYFEHVELKQSG
ncbi:uncharacterized protein [Syngnathus scovelli]|uniref:uncharacterized protein isoform X1 n=1 Tax=Syngnathus scovelli TaxID=161590 RepID=UPI00210F925C|nr:uncharacterized protein LOC125990513 isoform X2 [Syngnathus scovelli]